MKKFLVLLLTTIFILVTLCGMSFARGSFIKSPSYHDDVVIDFEIPEGCDAVLEYTHFSKRNQLSPESKKRIEDAYNILSTVKQICDIVPGITDKDLGVVDIFDVSYAPGFETEQYHIEHKHDLIKVIFSSDQIKNFAYLIKYNNEEFSVVRNVKRDGNTITFFQEECAAYAIVVRTGNPDVGTGDSSIMWALIIAAVCVVGIATTIIISKKNKENS